MIIEDRPLFGSVKSPIEFQIKYLIDLSPFDEAIMVRYYVEDWYFLVLAESPLSNVSGKNPPLYDIPTFLDAFCKSGFEESFPDYSRESWEEVILDLCKKEVFYKDNNTDLFCMHPDQKVEIVPDPSRKRRP